MAGPPARSGATSRSRARCRGSSSCSTSRRAGDVLRRGLNAELYRTRCASSTPRARGRLPRLAARTLGRARSGRGARVARARLVGRWTRWACGRWVSGRRAASSRRRPPGLLRELELPTYRRADAASPLDGLSFSRSPGRWSTPSTTCRTSPTCASGTSAPPTRSRPRAFCAPRSRRPVARRACRAVPSVPIRRR